MSDTPDSSRRDADAQAPPPPSAACPVAPAANPIPAPSADTADNADAAAPAADPAPASVSDADAAAQSSEHAAASENGDTVEVVEIPPRDRAAVHRVWGWVAALAILVAAGLVVLFKGCSASEHAVDAARADAKALIRDAKTVAGKISAAIFAKGDTNFSFALRFAETELTDRYVLASNVYRVEERITRKKWGSSAERVIVGDAAFEYYVALADGVRIEATQTQDGVPIICCIFGDLKLDTPVKFELREQRDIKDGFFIDEEAMVSDFLKNGLQTQLAAEGNGEVKRAFATEKARLSIRRHFLPVYFPDFPWNKARVRIEFDSRLLNAPADETFQVEIAPPPAETAPNAKPSV